MILIKETAGDTLIGVIDGVNQTYETTFDFASGSMNVYLNGILMRQDLETGYDMIPPRTVVMREPPLSDPDGADTLEIEYRADIKTGGGALGGRPEPMLVDVVAPDGMEARQDIPDVEADNMEPSTGAHTARPTTLAGDTLRPAMITTADPEGCS